MARKKVKLAWIENPNARATNMRKRRLGLLTKVRELTILCDLKGCIIIFSPNDDKPMVWPSVEATRKLLDHFFALPEVEKVKRETTLESYMKQKITKMHEKVAKLQKKNKEYGIDLLMDQMNRNRETANLTLSEIYTLLSFLKEKIILCRKNLGPALFPPIRSPPMVPFGLQFEEFRTRTRTYDVPVRGHESARNDELAGERLNIGTAIMRDQGQYVLDQWVPIHSDSGNHQQIGMNQVCYNEYPDFRSYLPFQGSSSNGNPNLEMEPVFPQLVMTFYDLGGSVTQSFQHLRINSPTEAMSQPMQYSFDPMSHEYNGYGVNEEECNINNGGSACYRRNNNTIAFNDGIGQVPPSNGTTAAGEGNVDMKPINISRPPGF